MTVFDICAFRLRRGRGRRRFPSCERRLVTVCNLAPLARRGHRQAARRGRVRPSRRAGLRRRRAPRAAGRRARLRGRQGRRTRRRPWSIPEAPRRALVVGLGDRDDFEPERARVAGGDRGPHRRLDGRHIAGARRTGGRRPERPWRPRWSRARSSPPTASTASSRRRGDDEDGGPEATSRSSRVIADGDLAEAVEAARVGAEAENFARELQDLPSNVVTPSYLAGRAKAIADEHDSVTCEVMGRKRDRREGHGRPGGRLAGHRRGAAADRAPLPGRRRRQTLGLVGKGVTFDSGGISIKPSGGMQEMKMDMSGRGRGAGGRLGDREARAADQRPGRHPLHREHAERDRGQARRHHHPAERQDGRGQQHRRRGPADPGRRTRLLRSSSAPTGSSTWPP